MSDDIKPPQIKRRRILSAREESEIRFGGKGLRWMTPDLDLNKQLDLNDWPQLIEAVEEAAKQHGGGHLTLYKFTTNWKVLLGTHGTCGDDTMNLREALRAAPPYRTLKEALRGLLVTLGETDHLYGEDQSSD